MRLFSSLILLSLLLTLISCDSAPKTGLSSEEEQLFIETYVKLVLATWDQPADADSLTVLRQGVFQEMGTSEEHFMELSHRAEAHPERWAEVWDQIVQRLEAQPEDG